MRRPSAVLLTLLLPVLAAAAFGEPLPTPEEYRMAVSTANARGVALWVHDWGASVASDVLMDRKVFSRDHRLRGWLTDVVKDEAVLVTFVGDEGGAPMALYRVRVPVGKARPEYRALKPAEPLSDPEAARWRARAHALDELQKRQDLCAEQYNSVVLSPDPAPDGLIHVYLLAATNKPGVIVAGGHFRYDYSPDGNILETQRAFTKSCFEVPAPDTTKGKPVAFFLTHLLDPTPTEIHVFLNRLHGQAVIVGTSVGNWAVADGEIRLMDLRDKPPAPGVSGGN